MSKICFLCGEDCANDPRQKDHQGRYAHISCVRLMAQARDMTIKVDKHDDYSWQQLKDVLTEVQGFKRNLDAERQRSRRNSRASRDFDDAPLERKTAGQPGETAASGDGVRFASADPEALTASSSSTSEQKASSSQAPAAAGTKAPSSASASASQRQSRESPRTQPGSPSRPAVDATPRSTQRQSATEVVDLEKVFRNVAKTPKTPKTPAGGPPAPPQPRPTERVPVHVARQTLEDLAELGPGRAPGSGGGSPRTPQTAFRASPGSASPSATVGFNMAYFTKLAEEQKPKQAFPGSRSPESPPSMVFSPGTGAGPFSPVNEPSFSVLSTPGGASFSPSSLSSAERKGKAEARSSPLGPGSRSGTPGRSRSGTPGRTRENGGASPGSRSGTPGRSRSGTPSRTRENGGAKSGTFGPGASRASPGTAMTAAASPMADCADVGIMFRKATTAAEREVAAEAIRPFFKLEPKNVLLGVFSCCKGDNPLDAGELFVFEKYLCFRKHKSSTAQGISAVVGSIRTTASAATRFAIPMEKILDVSHNRGVYPFGALLVTIKDVKRPWLFSFFTEREDALKCVRGAIAAIADAKAQRAVSIAAKAVSEARSATTKAEATVATNVVNAIHSVKLSSRGAIGDGSSREGSPAGSPMQFLAALDRARVQGIDFVKSVGSGVGGVVGNLSPRRTHSPHSPHSPGLQAFPYATPDKESRRAMTVEASRSSSSKLKREESSEGSGNARRGNGGKSVKFNIPSPFRRGVENDDEAARKKSISSSLLLGGLALLVAALSGGKGEGGGGGRGRREESLHSRDKRLGDSLSRARAAAGEVRRGRLFQLKGGS